VRGLEERLANTSMWEVVRERDLLYVRLTGTDLLVIAADSNGGLGPKSSDTVAVSGWDLGRFAARVPLLEVIAIGATPTVLVDTLSVERDPTGAAILEGVRAEAAAAGLPLDAVTGSTEDNVPTVATGVGVTVIARARLDDLRVGRARHGDVVVLVGRPKSAPADVFGPDDPEVLTVGAVRAVLDVPGVHEVLPIGSSGVAAEVDALARSAGARAEHAPDWPVARDQSGGPSTAALVAVRPTSSVDTVVYTLRAASGLPAWAIATLV
jgi:AIR synthase related protein, N-terminal domain